MLKVKWHGVGYYACSRDCARAFLAEPAKYAKKADALAQQATSQSTALPPQVRR
jgi:hypothetical protein